MVMGSFVKTTGTPLLALPSHCGIGALDPSACSFWYHDADKEVAQAVLVELKLLSKLIFSHSYLHYSPQPHRADSQNKYTFLKLVKDFQVSLALPGIYRPMSNTRKPYWSLVGTAQEK
jgi:hypothetical protein